MTKLAQCTACKNFTHEGACKYYKYLDDSSCEQYELPLNNSKGMFARIFSFKGRIRRLEYVLTYLLYMSFSYFANLIDFENGNLFDLVLGFIWLLLVIPAVWIGLAQGAKRCHDRGNSGWFQFIPFYIFWMFFADGVDGPNRYGTSPKKDYESQIYKP